jgi:hypothetical protein
MGPYVVPVAVRTVALGGVTLVLWFFVKRDEGFGPLLEVLWTLILGSAVWAAVDGVRGARRRDPFRVALLVWLLVAATTGLFQAVPWIVWDVQNGVGAQRTLRNLGEAWRYGLLVAVPAVAALGLTWAITPRPARRNAP